VPTVVRVAAKVEDASRYFRRERDKHDAFGVLPNRGSLSDILDCAGANEVLWTNALRQNPRDPEAFEAKRKASWYAAVALWCSRLTQRR